MKIHVQILDDKDEVLFEHRADASTPSQWKAPSGKPLISKMPQNSDNENNGTYELFGFTFQPQIRANRPNGWKAPVPPPNQTPAVPSNFPSQYSAPWSTSAPTPKSPTPNILAQGLVPTRG